MPEMKAATEVIDLPSKGWYYPKDHPLASGKLEVYFMTARHEDILTSTNLIRKGVVLDKLMEALIADSRVKYDDLFLGDKNALMIASRILGYGSEYTVNVECPSCAAKSEVDINLAELADKDITFADEMRYKNAFEFLLPFSKKTIVFKLLTHKDEVNIQKELDAIKKSTRSDVSTEITTRMRYAIVSVDGSDDRETVRTFVQNMPARDGVAFREYTRKINPDVDLTFKFECVKCGHEEPRMEVPIDVGFFWPNSRL
jgi:hypothetical protein